MIAPRLKVEGPFWRCYGREFASKEEADRYLAYLNRTTDEMRQARDADGRVFHPHPPGFGWAARPFNPLGFIFGTEEEAQP